MFSSHRLQDCRLITAVLLTAQAYHVISEAILSDLTLAPTNTTITATWVATDVPSDSRYAVAYREMGCGRDEQINHNDVNVTSVVITDLHPGYLYEVTISLHDEQDSLKQLTANVSTLHSAPKVSPQNFRIESATSTSVTFSWSEVACDDRNGRITTYTIFYMDNLCGTPTEKMFTVNAPEISATVQDLSPGQIYSFSISASTAAGAGPKSEPAVQSRTNEQAPMGRVQSFKIVKVTSRSVTFAWTELACDEQNGFITSYNIYYMDNLCSSPIEKSFTIVAPNVNATINHMSPGQNYSFTISANTSAGEGPKSLPVWGKTDDEAPVGTADGLAVANVTSRSIRLTGLDVACEKRNGIIQYYFLRITSNHCGNSMDLRVQISGEKKEVTLQPLSPGQDYSLIVTPFTYGGPGPSTTAMLLRTSDEPPDGQPEALQCRVESHNSVSLRWDPVRCAESNGLINNYQVQWKRNGNDKSEGKNVSASNTTMTHIISELSAATDYDIYVTGSTSAGYSKAVSCDVRTSADPGVIAASTVGSLAGVAFGVVVVLFVYKRRQRSNQPQTTPAADTRAPVPEPVPLRKRPIKLSEMEVHVKNMHMNSNFLFDNEYRDLRDLSPKHPTAVAKLEGNLAKNRFVDILPFDHNRVKLLPTEDDDCSDFINASYMPGNRSRRDYIAAQGPLPGTIENFWQMIWEQNVPLIVMLTQLIEKGKRKCEQYWPEALNEPQRYGEITVIKNVELIKPDYTVRFMEMQLRGQVKTLIHCHYTTWPDHGCPQSTDVMLEFTKAVQSRRPKEVAGPTLVHCSAGVGRTGTYICIERLVKQLESEDSAQAIDIFGMVLDMRNYRTRIVQTEDQYVFIHDCIKDFVTHKRSSSFNDSAEYVNFGGPSSASPDSWPAFKA